jgi:hypothetical protein
LIAHLDRRFNRAPPPAVKFARLEQVEAEALRLIRFLAAAGGRDNEQVESAVAAALQSLGLAGLTKHPPPAAREDDLQFGAVYRAIHQIGQAAPSVKRQVLKAVAIAILADRKVTVEEAELFRAVGEALDCPVPLLVAGNLSP